MLHQACHPKPRLRRCHWNHRAHRLKACCLRPRLSCQVFHLRACSELNKNVKMTETEKLPRTKDDHNKNNENDKTTTKNNDKQQHKHTTKTMMITTKTTKQQ